MNVYAEVGGERPASPPDYFGGEFYGVSGAMLKRLLPLAKEVQLKNDALAGAAKAYFSDEAHFFSYLVWRLGLRAPNANHIARRNWTTRSLTIRKPRI